ncbi:MAG TPA: Gfo/Idh/MocA family oxidoreductase [Gemmataceae bacterium]|jgi:predicted dehydrogenase
MQLGWITRRRFLATSVGMAGLAGYYLGRTPVRLGLIGAGTQGTLLTKALNTAWWLGGPCGSIVAVCDVDRSRAEALRGAHCPKAEITGDYRHVLERDDIRAVLIATPDHWHARIAVEALHAGKAVYCEKPISLTVAEGQALVRAVRQTGGVFQAGTQQRTMARFRGAVELVRGGALGRLHTITVTLPERWKGEGNGPFPTLPVPPGLDWDTWLGQAPWAEYCPQRCHGFFRRWYEYSGGQITDWGAHHIDIAQWAIGDDAAPLTVEGHGEFPEVTGGFNTPIEFRAEMTYAGGVRLVVRSDPTFEDNGVLFEGDRASLFVNRAKLEGTGLSRPADRVEPLYPRSAARTNALAFHVVQFLIATKTGDTPVSDVASQHRSATTCHLANIAMRLGRKFTWDARREQVVGDAEANAMLSRPQRSPYQVPAV